MFHRNHSRPLDGTVISDMFVYFLSQASGQITLIRGLSLMLRKPEMYLWQQVSKLFIYVPWYRVIVVALVTKFMLLNFSFSFFFCFSPWRHIIFSSFYLMLDVPRSFPLLNFLFFIYLSSNVFWLANAQRTERTCLTLRVDPYCLSVLFVAGTFLIWWFFRDSK